MDKKNGIMNKNLVFVSLFGLTESYLKIAKELTPEGYQIFWIYTNEHYTALIVADGLPREHILQLIYRSSDFLSPTEKEALHHEIAQSETSCDFSLNAAMLMDRFVTSKSIPRVNEYVYLYYRDIKRFLQKNQIGWVFGEPTNVNDLITYMVCRELNIKYVFPTDMRFPTKRLLFFEGYQQKTILPNLDSKINVNGRELLEQFCQREPTPFYFVKQSRERVIRPGRILKSIIRRTRSLGTVSGRSLTHYDAWGRLKLTCRRALNSFYMRHLCHYDDLSRVNGKLAFYPLHVQPERTIDVLGPYNSDQLKLIKDIRRSLPFDTTLLVKEHPNFLGMKNIGFFRALQRIPNVKLIKHDVPSFAIYKKVQLVLTISGTAAYEAGLLGIPAITFAPMYFGNLSSVHECTDITKLKELVTRLLNGFERDYAADCAFLEKLVKQSYDGYWSDPFEYSDVCYPDNIQKLKNAFLSLLRSSDVG